MLSVIRDLAHEHDLTMLLVTHEMRFAREVSDRVCFFDKGRICEQETGRDFGQPKEERTRVSVVCFTVSLQPSQLTALIH